MTEKLANLPAPNGVPLNRWVVFFSIAAVGCALDLGTKAWAFSVPALRAGDIAWLWEGHMGVQLSRNMGALFGIGQGKVWLFATLGMVAAIAIPLWLFVYQAARDPIVTVAMGSVMAGVLGNLFDRLGLSREAWSGPLTNSPEVVHAVRDWILWQVNDQWRWPNFNVADAMLVCGACLLFYHAWRQPSPEVISANGPGGG